MFEEICAAIGALDGARALLVTGVGRAFCSGADVAGGSLNADDPAEATYRALTACYNPALLAIAELAVPVVSAVRGPAAGIGCAAWRWPPISASPATPPISCRRSSTSGWCPTAAPAGCSPA